MLLALAFLPLPATARTKTHRNSTIASRRRLNVSSMITDPGTFEVEWNHWFATDGEYTMPSTLKYTPDGDSILWGSTEYSVSFDGIDSTNAGGTRTTQFSDHIDLNVTSVLASTKTFSLAVAPQATVWLRGDSGVRVGATLLARSDFSSDDNVGFAASWTGATQPSPTNPAGTLDIGGSYGHRLSHEGILNRVTAHVNIIWERSTGYAGYVSYYEGAEYEFNDNVSLDVSGQQVGNPGAPRTYQVVVGLTVNFGRPSKWFR
jgi:hypothetical protein